MLKVGLTLKDRLSYQRGLNDLCTDATMRHPLHDTVRHFFSSAAFLLALDFHKHLSRNLEQGSHAVAAALLRPIWECGVTAAWFLYRAEEAHLFRIYANPLDLDHLWRQEADVPTPQQMLEELAELEYIREYALNQKQLMAKGGRGKIFHKYTHPTVFQLKRTFVTSQKPTRFDEAELRGMIDLADMLMLASAAVFQAQTQDHDLNLVIKERYNEQLSKLPPQEPPLTPWSPLPKSLMNP